MHSASGDRQPLSGLTPPAPGEVDAQRVFCLLYAMLMLQPRPTPVEVEKDSQVGKTRSIVPSRSARRIRDQDSEEDEWGRENLPISAKVIGPVPRGSGSLCLSLKDPVARSFSHTWKDCSFVLGSSQTRNRSIHMR
jgi:hypothetical protein